MRFCVVQETHNLTDTIYVQICKTIHMSLILYLQSTALSLSINQDYSEHKEMAAPYDSRNA